MQILDLETGRHILHQIKDCEIEGCHSSKLFIQLLLFCSGLCCVKTFKEIGLLTQ